MTALNTPPSGVGEFGHDFNYAVWTPGTNIQLCNVAWADDYRDVVAFRRDEDLDNYIFDMSPGPYISIERMTYIAPHRGVRVDLPYGAVLNYNYLRVSNPGVAPGDSARTYYYFIQDARYLAPNTTELVLQLDVWQTYSRGMLKVRGYLERGHMAMGNYYRLSSKDRKRAFQEWLTQPEGLDLGSDYVNFERAEYEIATTRWVDKPKYDVMIVSTISLIGLLGDVSNPIVNTATGSMAEGLPNGTDAYIVDGDKFRDVMIYLSGRPWATQGIISITVLPDGAKEALSMASGDSKIGTVPVKVVSHSGAMANDKIEMLKDWPDRHPYRTFRNGRYRFLHKFLTSPYTFIEITCFTGTPVLLKPEYLWDMTKLELVRRNHYVPPSPRITFAPLAYNISPHSPMAGYTISGNNVDADDGDGFNHSTGIFNLPTFSIPNSGFLNYMASNTHSIAFQRQSADWTQQRALAGNQLGYDQASMGINTMQQMTNLGINAATAQMNLSNQTSIYRGAQSGINSAIGGAMLGRGGIAGGAMGMANAAAGAAIDINQTTGSTAIANNLARGQLGAQSAQAAYNRDTNKSYADWAAKGDYANTIAGINARVQDAMAIPPTVAGQVGGDAFLLATHKWGLWATVKTINPSAMAVIGDYWLRYGYPVNRWINVPEPNATVARWQCMSKFTYWKFRETYILDTYMPEAYKQTLRGILEKGVTVWHDPAAIWHDDPMSINVPIEPGTGKWYFL